jgi:hypothetical protein
MYQKIRFFSVPLFEMFLQNWNQHNILDIFYPYFKRKNIFALRKDTLSFDDKKIRNLPHKGTIANWLIFRPQNSKSAQQKCLRPRKWPYSKNEAKFCYYVVKKVTAA